MPYNALLRKFEVIKAMLAACGVGCIAVSLLEVEHKLCFVGRIFRHDNVFPHKPVFMFVGYILTCFLNFRLLSSKLPAAVRRVGCHVILGMLQW